MTNNVKNVSITGAAGILPTLPYLELRQESFMEKIQK